MDNAIQILLITTRNTRRWIVPKGWPLEGHTPANAPRRKPWKKRACWAKWRPSRWAGFSYDKLRKIRARSVPCRVQVYPMEVLRQRRTWAEKAARQTRWCSAEEALSHVGELGLRQLIRKFARDAGHHLNHPAPRAVG